MPEGSTTFGRTVDQDQKIDVSVFLMFVQLSNRRCIWSFSTFALISIHFYVKKEKN